jgi:hypothetical protein
VDTNPGYALAAAILRELEPRQLPALPGVWKAYEQRPARPEELHGRDDLNRSVPRDQVIAWAPLVLAFLCTEVFGAAAEAGDGPPSREPEPQLTPSLEFSGEEIKRIHTKAVETALGLGEEPAQAVLFADAVAGGLSRLSPPRDGD